MKSLVVIPTYNEVGNAGAVLRAIAALGPDFSAMVVDDASPDGTAGAVLEVQEALPGRITLVGRPAKGGHGSAYRQGLAQALRTDGHGALFVMDCDFSHDPAAIPELLRALDDSDVAIGSRYVPGGRIVGWGWHRQILSRTANAVARALLGLPIRDCTSGFMGFRREALLSIPLEAARAEGYAAPVEMKWLAFRAGLRMREVPITFRDRERGQSKLDASHLARAARALWMLSAERRTGPAARTPASRAPGQPRVP